MNVSYFFLRGVDGGAGGGVIAAVATAESGPWIENVILQGVYRYGLAKV